MIQTFESRTSWVTLSGPDAQDFLHRLTTVHVRALSVGAGAKGCFLNAQGKIRALFTLWNFGPGDYAFELEAGREGAWKKELLAAIDQYTFAEKIAVADVQALECRWILADAAEAPALLERLGVPGLTPLRTIALDEEVRLCRHSDAEFGRLWISAWGRPARLAQWLARALSEARPVDGPTLEKWRVQALTPRVDAEVTPDTIPLEVGLVDAIASDKGCYPGQEVIERITSLGSPARRLARLEGRGPAPTPGEPILNLAEPPAEIGQVTSVAASGDGFEALGLVRKIHAKEGLEARFGKSGGQGKVVAVAPYARAE